MARKLAFLMAISALAATCPLAAQQPAPQPACTAPEHRQFDFWLGEWEVTNPAGKPAGLSRIESILGECVILENWATPKAVAFGKSFNTYNRNTGQWEQFWVDRSGVRLHLTGGLKDGNMVLSGRQDKPNAKTGLTQRERITWTPGGDGSVRQLWETSVDDGKTWSVSFDGTYRRPGAAPE